MTIDRDQAIVLLKKYADAEPDKVVTCRYTKRYNNGNLVPVCIVGQILINDLGVDPEILAVTADVFSRTLIRDLRIDLDITGDAIDILSLAQRYQDGNYRLETTDGRLAGAGDPLPWGQAVERAIRETAR